MIIQHNMAAANTNRQLGITTGNLAKSTEKLSSGYRINRAGDDAAGLTISEKMRGQIRGLEQASTNAQDGISLIQTAEGALDETHNILQRMRELSVQGANDTNTAEDREAIAKEITALTSEIDRIANDTEFNTKSLLDGSFKGEFQIGANSKQTISVSINKMDSASLGLTSGTKFELGTAVAAVGTGKLQEGSYTINGAKVLDNNGNEVGKVSGATTGQITLGDGATKYTLGVDLTKGGSISVNSDNKVTDVTINHATDASGLAAGEYKVSGTNLLLGDKLVGTIDAGSGALTLSGQTAALDVSKYGIDATNLKTNGYSFTVKGIDVEDSSKATNSLTTLDNAIKSVSSQRSSLGAVQNRLEHTISNLDNSAENLQSAESRIRDVDMAAEMVNFSKGGILQQAAQSMLAQANQQTQGVLSLLR